ncbi:unnamed protein product [Periconia digitata]|uniref:Cytochrome P450 n=1 Tax=Periconia digitata TaxID=1303443 RepID=A0A9W4UMF4_9PLEO|nr:unnamed protein product [Periconia digitata]
MVAPHVNTRNRSCMWPAASKLEIFCSFFRAIPVEMAIHTLVSAILLVVVYAVGVVVYRLWWHPLASLPGPKLWAISRLPWLWHMVKGDLWRALARLHDEFGDTIRIAPNEVTTLSTSAWQEIYTAQPLLLKDTFSQTPPMNGSPSLFTAENETHKRIRGILAFAFSSKALREQAALIEHHNSRFVARINRELEQHKILDINKFYGYVAFDTITDLSYGESTACLDIPGPHTWIEKFFLHAQYSAVRNSLRWYSPIDKILDFCFLGITRKTREKNWSVAAAKIDRRLSTREARADLLTPVIGRVSEEENPRKGVTKKEILSNALALVIADCQLTAGALTSCTYFLLKSPGALKEVVKEVRSAFQRDGDITVQAVQDLVYLGAVLNETLRIHHPSPISLPRTMPANSSRVISGTLIPGNTIVGVSLQNIFHCPKYWHKPDEFHPERFLPPSDLRYDPMFDSDNRAAFMPFSTGPRNCIGAKLFFAQARLALAKLIWNFDIQGAEPCMDTWPDHRVFIVLEPKPLHVRLTRRES